VFKVLTVLLFLPSITFGAYNSEIFPWGIIFSLFYLRHINKYILLLIILMGFSCSLVLAHSFLNGGSIQTDIIRSIAAYMNFILLSQTLLLLGSKNVKIITTLSRNIFWVLIILGFIQSIGSETLGTLIQYLIPRGDGSALSEINRGVTLLSTEPARAGIELTLIYLIYRIGQQNTFKNVAIDIFLIFYQALIIKSFSVVVFSLGAFAILHVNFRFYLFSTLATLLVGFFGLYFIINLLPQFGGRAGDLVIFLQETEALNDAIFYIANESGNRVLGLYSFYLAGINHPFGFGIGSWPYSSIQAVLESGLDFRDFRFFDVVGNGEIVAFRGAGVISNLMLDLGLIGTILSFYLFRKMMLSYAEFSELSKKAFWIFLFKIAFFGSPGNPIVFIFFIVVFLTTAPNNKLINKQKDTISQI
tara:strand:- start:9396 stop:10646 length:1251 start_codon:yes stop_codon:yes gene_type:complete